MNKETHQAKTKYLSFHLTRRTFDIGHRKAGIDEGALEGGGALNVPTLDPVLPDPHLLPSPGLLFLTGNMKELHFHLCFPIVALILIHI